MHPLEGERTRTRIPGVVRTARQIRVDRVRAPSAVGSHLPFQESPGRLHARIVPIAEAHERLEADQDVVIIMDRMGKPLPGRVSTTAFSEQFPLEVKLGPSIHRKLPLPRPPTRPDARVRTERLPTIQPRGRTAAAVTSHVLSLSVRQP